MDWAIAWLPRFLDDTSFGENASRLNQLFVAPLTSSLCGGKQCRNRGPMPKL